MACTQTPYAFHPMYATSGEHTRVPWAAHSYNVAFADEIGHFEYCRNANPHGKCVVPGGVDGETNTQEGCRRFRVLRCGRVAPDPDRGMHRDRQRLRWSLVPDHVARIVVEPCPGCRGQSGLGPVLESDVRRRSELRPSGFEADLPRIEAADFGGSCDRTDGANCVNPPPGSNFYPFFSTRPTLRSAASGSSAVRTSPERRTRSVGAPPRSSVRCCSSTTQWPGWSRPTVRTTSDRC